MTSGGACPHPPARIGRVRAVRKRFPRAAVSPAISAGRPAGPHPLGRDVELLGIGVLLRPPRGGRLAVAGHALALATRHFGLPALRPPAQPAQHPPLHHRKPGSRGEGGGRPVSPHPSQRRGPHEPPLNAPHGPLFLRWWAAPLGRHSRVTALEGRYKATGRAGAGSESASGALPRSGCRLYRRHVAVHRPARVATSRLCNLSWAACNCYTLEQ